MQDLTVLLSPSFFFGRLTGTKHRQRRSQRTGLSDQHKGFGLREAGS